MWPPFHAIFLFFRNTLIPDLFASSNPLLFRFIGWEKISQLLKLPATETFPASGVYNLNVTLSLELPFLLIFPIPFF